MKKTTTLILFLIILISVTACSKPAASPPVSPSLSTDVEISGFSFNPVSVTIQKGTTMVWTNKDPTKHTVTSDSGTELDSDLLSEGETYTHTFGTPGTYEYHCKPHQSMKGKIIVVE